MSKTNQQNENINVKNICFLFSTNYTPNGRNEFWVQKEYNILVYHMAEYFVDSILLMPPSIYMEFSIIKQTL